MKSPLVQGALLITLVFAYAVAFIVIFEDYLDPRPAEVERITAGWHKICDVGEYLHANSQGTIVCIPVSIMVHDFTPLVHPIEEETTESDDTQVKGVSGQINYTFTRVPPSNEISGTGSGVRILVFPDFAKHVKVSVADVTIDQSISEVISSNTAPLPTVSGNATFYQNLPINPPPCAR